MRFYSEGSGDQSCGRRGRERGLALPVTGSGHPRTGVVRARFTTFLAGRSAAPDRRLATAQDVSATGLASPVGAVCPPRLTSWGKPIEEASTSPSESLGGAVRPGEPVRGPMATRWLAPPKQLDRPWDESCPQTAGPGPTKPSSVST